MTWNVINCLNSPGTVLNVPSTCISVAKDSASRRWGLTNNKAWSSQSSVVNNP